jgi:gluconolactonase
MVDVAWGRILTMTPEGQFSVMAEYDGAPNGLKIHRDGSIYIADFHKGILQLDPENGAVTPLHEGFGGKAFNGCNDLVFASNGDLYFTDQGWSGLHDPFGRLFRIRPDGELDLILDGIPSPNGLVLDLAERAVLLNVTRANAVWRVPFDGETGVSKVGTFIQLSGGMGPDGLAMDAAGNLAVAHIGLGTVWLFSASGEPLLRVDSPAGRMTTNVAYGGADGRSLFITESETGSILTVRMPEAGRPMFSHLSEGS